MTDGQWLFTVFATLYLLECLRWVPLSDWLVTEKRAGRWSFLRPSKMLSARGLGLVLLAPIPPFRAHLSLSPWRFIPERDHLLVMEEEGQTSRVPWAEFQSRADGTRVLLGTRSMVRLTTEASAKEWSHRLNEWAALSPKDREDSFLELANQTLDPAALAQKAKRLSQGIRSLNTNAAVILIWCFGIVTGVYTWYGESVSLWGSVIVLWGLQLIQSVLFWRATRLDTDTLAVGYRFWKALSIALMPQFSIRAADHLCQAASQQEHPLAAHNLVETEQHRAAAEKFWRQARYFRGWTEVEALPLEAQALDRHFQAIGMSNPELETRPTRDPASMSYCPRCLTQFQLVAGECRDCHGTELRAFE
jgi:hypothetical protein